MERGQRSCDKPTATATNPIAPRRSRLGAPRRDPTTPRRNPTTPRRVPTVRDRQQTGGYTARVENAKRDESKWFPKKQNRSFSA